MGKVKALSQKKIEELCDAYVEGEITAAEFKEQALVLGVEDESIDGHLEALDAIK